MGEVTPLLPGKVRGGNDRAKLKGREKIENKEQHQNYRGLLGNAGTHLHKHAHKTVLEKAQIKKYF